MFKYLADGQKGVCLFFLFDSYVTGQKMIPGVLGMALQQRQEKEKLRCKQQGLPQQNTPQVGPPTHSSHFGSVLNCLLQFLLELLVFCFFYIRSIWFILIDQMYVASILRKHRI